jgi:ribonucleotide monophosphatase NagD (HAD superfamily)
MDQESPELFMEDIEKIAHQNIPLLCANPDRFAHEGNPPRLVVRQGLIAELAKAKGADVYFIGKPFPLVYEKALDLFSRKVSKDKILMVGDTPETDIRGARTIGLSTALVIKTGVIKERIGEENALHFIQQLSELEQPHHLIERFSIDAI